MASKGKNKSKLISRFLRAPVRFLIRARDFYIQSLTDCSGHLSMGCPTAHAVATLPRSFSVGSTRSYESTRDEDFRELVRAASTKSLSSIKRYETSDLPNKLRSHGQSPRRMPRSLSVGIGRIDEEKPSDFEEDVDVGKYSTYSRSRSYANNRRSSGLL